MSAMASITVPAFHAATSCHILSTVPLLQQQPLLTRNHSSALFTTPILYSHAKLVELGATVLQTDPQSSQNDSTNIALPHIDFFFDMNAAIPFPRISNTERQGTNQKRLTQWVKEHSPILKHVQNVIQADDSLRARLTHLSQWKIKGPHPRFDIPPELTLRFPPTAFLGNIWPMVHTEFSAAQLGQYLRFVLGLELPPPNTSESYDLMVVAPVAKQMIHLAIIGLLVIARDGLADLGIKVII